MPYLCFDAMTVETEGKTFHFSHMTHEANLVFVTLQIVTH